jgi:hypothetical protein
VRSIARSIPWRIPGTIAISVPVLLPLLGKALFDLALTLLLLGRDGIQSLLLLAVLFLLLGLSLSLDTGLLFLARLLLGLTLAADGLVLGLQPLLSAIVFTLLLSLGQTLSALLLHAMVEFLHALLKVGLALLQQIGHVGVMILLHAHQAIASLNG